MAEVLEIIGFPEIVKCFSSLDDAVTAVSD